MDTCAVEVGLLKKKPCGHPAASKCANCEMAICAKHAVRQPGGKFMCGECGRANRTIDTTPAPKPAAAPAAKPAAAPAAKPAPAAPAAKPPAPAPAAKAPAVAPTQPAGKTEFKLEETGPIEFTPEKKK
jgi:glucose/arabinose dehydrogenase